MTSINTFLLSWDKDYSLKVSKIPLFASNIELSREQQKKFVATFYHLRGHFYRFLWYLAGRAPNSKFKKIILANISEEFGGQLDSHEELYWNFASSVGIDIVKEVLNPKYNYQFTEEFNYAHLKFILEESWPAAWAAFAAYERLDNIDYLNLHKLAQSFGLTKDQLTFFEAHTRVTHFEKTSPLLEILYLENPKEVEKGFEFISSHQIKMWQNLSDCILN